MAERTGRHCSGAIGLTLKIDGANSGILASVLHSSLIKTGGRPERPIVALTKSARAHRQEPGRSAARCDPKEFFIGQLVDPILPIREFSRLKRLDGNCNNLRDFRRISGRDLPRSNGA